MSIDVNAGLAFGAAVLTFIASFLALLPLMRNRTKAITAPLDPSIKVIKIERLPIDQEEWFSWRLRAMSSLILLIIMVVGAIVFTVYGIIQSYTGDPGSLLSLIFGVIFIPLIASPLIPVLIHPPPIIRFRNAKDAKYFIFQKADIYVEGDINYIYFKTHAALRGRSIQNIEADFYAHTFEAYRSGTLNKSAGRITIVIETVNEHTKCYSLQVNYVNADGSTNSTASSAFINQFLGYFLTIKP